MAKQVSAVDDILAEYQGLEMQLSDPELHNDVARARKVGKRYSELQSIIKVHTELTQVRADLADAREMAHEDHDFVSEVERLAAREVELEEQLADLLAPRDPHDGDDIVIRPPWKNYRFLPAATTAFCASPVLWPIWPSTIRCANGM